MRRGSVRAEIQYNKNREVEKGGSRRGFLGSGILRVFSRRRRNRELRCDTARRALFSEHMVDIHCHILPGFDDGPDSVELACAMAEMAIADGITHLIATPHASPEFAFDSQEIAERRRELQERFAGRITLATGCDFHMSFENLQDIRSEPERYTLNQKNYLLVEFADFSIPPSIDQTLHELQLAGLTPVITHPERNPLIRAKPERLFKWVQQGCYVQVTAGSITGKFGRGPKEAAWRWLDAGAVHFLASDAHNVTSRPPVLTEAYDEVARTRGKEVAEALCAENPMAAFNGEALPFVPEVVREGEAGMGRKKRFWLF
jgi:protein-tyrosine phosphatase